MNVRSLSQRVIALLLSFVLLTGMLPVGAMAAEDQGNVTQVVEETSAPAAAAVELDSDAPTETTVPATTEAEPDSETAPADPKAAKTEEDQKPGKGAAKKPGKDKKTEATEPSTKATEPSTKATEPSTEVTEPSTEATEPEVIAVTSITLDQTALEVGVGELPVILTATVLPEDATDKTVTWTSTEPGVASVDENGKLTFGYMGEAVITATAGEFTATCTVTVGEGEWDTYEGGIVVIAASDYQLSNSSTIMTNIMNQIKEDYGTPYAALLGGDYDAGDVNTTANHIRDVDDVISSVFPNLSSDNRIYIQGNHENFAGLKVDGTNLMDTTGEHDTDYYGVYVINHDDFPWFTSSNPKSSQKLVQATADALGTYLDTKMAAGYSEPIFVISHLPLAATTTMPS